MSLPIYAAVLLPSTGEPVIVERGCAGYLPMHPALTLETFNEHYEASPAQCEAMLAGSMFGWHVPAADPDNYAADGSIKL